MANGQQHDVESILAACLSPDNMRRAQAESALKVCILRLQWYLVVSTAFIHLWPACVHSVTQLNRPPYLRAGIVQAARHPGDPADGCAAVGECRSAPPGVTDSAKKLEAALAPTVQGGKATLPSFVILNDNNTETVATFHSTRVSPSQRMLYKAVHAIHRLRPAQKLDCWRHFQPSR